MVLCLHILSVYEASNIQANGQVFGGHQKQSMILGGAAGFKLVSGKSTLSDLVSDLTPRNTTLHSNPSRLVWVTK